MKRGLRWKRINYYGFTPDEADNCPAGMPIWMYRIEQDEGMTVREIIEDTAETARETGYSMADLAREWGVPRSTIQHWASKWGIQFPNHCSVRYMDNAMRAIKQVNERRKEDETNPPRHAYHYRA